MGRVSDIHRAQICQILRCAADEMLVDPWAPMANLYEIAKQLGLYPFSIDEHTDATIRAWRAVDRVWREHRLSWPVCCLEAAMRVENAHSPNARGGGR